jgi:hypothetical protein
MPQVGAFKKNPKLRDIYIYIGFLAVFESVLLVLCSAAVRVRLLAVGYFGECQQSASTNSKHTMIGTRNYRRSLWYGYEYNRNCLV